MGSIDAETTRSCGRCGEAKPLSAFAWRRKAKGQRHNYCRPCHAAYHREHYLANKQRYIDQAAERARRIAEERAEYLVAFFKSHPCTDCGEPDPVVLEFDHLSDKRFDVGKGIRDRNWQSVLDEIAKCEVVCANCHRRRTAHRGGFIRALVAQR
jgi:hypothetical protein